MISKTEDSFGTYQYGEGTTGIGQAVAFSCRSGQIDTVKAFLAENVRTIAPPGAHKVSIEHGSYTRYSRYNVVSHRYVGGQGGFLEVLEIKDAPDERCGIVFYNENTYKGSWFTEWDSIEQAKAALEKFLGAQQDPQKLATLPGFKRHVDCGVLMPWFYAIGDEELVGDYTLPRNLHDDPVYRLGRQFLVFDHDGIPSVKVCLGSRYVKEKNRYRRFDGQEYSEYRMVYWNDGSTWKEGPSKEGCPRFIEDGELWIAEAVRQFRELLAGKRTDFSIKFTDDTQFVGKLKRVGHAVACAQGRYHLVVNMKGKTKPNKGWMDFTPTPEYPDPIQYVTKKYADKGVEIERIEITESTVTPGGKKWAGVYYGLSKSE